MPTTHSIKCTHPVNLVHHFPQVSNLNSNLPLPLIQATHIYTVQIQQFQILVSFGEEDSPWRRSVDWLWSPATIAKEWCPATVRVSKLGNSECHARNGPYDGADAGRAVPTVTTTVPPAEGSNVCEGSKGFGGTNAWAQWVSRNRRRARVSRSSNNGGGNGARNFRSN